MSALLIRNVGLLATPLQEHTDQVRREVERIPRAAIYIRNGLISEIGPEEKVRPVIPQGTDEYDAGGALALPGLIDCHTHPVFIGNRAAEFHLRNAGKSYLEIAEAGGGIQASARKVREASIEQIVTESLPRLQRSLMSGVTTLEAKSGYGLEWEGEVKLLEAISVLEKQVPQRIHKTFLIHALPESYQNRREEFCREVVERMIPAVAERKLAAAVDVFCETGAFTVEESRMFLRAAQDRNLKIKVHANQFGHSGGALLAAELRAGSAEHLEYLNDDEITAMADAGVTAVVLPGCVFYLGTLPYPPVRRMLELGLRVVVATDMNPGSAMSESLPFSLTAAAIYCHMNPEELLWSVTLDAARVLSIEKQTGSLEAGKAADISLWRLPDLESLSYHFGNLTASAVFIDGSPVWSDPLVSPRY